MAASRAPTTAQPEQRKPPLWLNRVLKALLRSPFHGLLSKNLLLLTFTGRKSGKQYTTPLSRIDKGPDNVAFFTRTGWWRNLEGGAPVTVRLSGRDRKGIAVPSNDPQAVLQEAKAFLAERGWGASRMIGIELDAKQSPTDAELATLLSYHVVIHITLQRL